MADHVAADATPLNATEVRFGTRSLLVVMAVAAVFATALGAFIRQFPADVQPRLLVFWSALAAIMAAIVVFHAWRRRVAERKSGRTLVQLARHRFVHYFLDQPTWVMYLVGGLMLMIAPAAWAISSLVIASGVPGAWGKLGDGDRIYLLLLLGNSLAISGAAISSFWWRRIRLCKNGVVVHNIFLPWKNCKHWYWDTDATCVLMIEFSGYGTLSIRVSEDLRATVEAILIEKAPGKLYD